MSRDTGTRRRLLARSGLAGRRVRPSRLAGFAAALLAGLLLAVGGSAPAGAAVPSFPSFQSLSSLSPSSSTTCSTAYYDGDSRLGPAQFQTVGPVASELRGYNRLAGLSPQQYISTYWDPTANGGSGGWSYPPDNGYLVARGQPIEYPATLSTGENIDRFGSEFGAFLAPEYTPYAERSLPPMSLDDFDAGYTCNYHDYSVLKPFQVDEGPIAPAFGQPGYGLQIQLNSALVPDAPSPLNVLWLVSNGYLARDN